MCSAGGALGGSAGSPRAGTVTHCPRMGRAWQVEPCGIRGAQGSELTLLWPHLAVRPGTASPASTAPLLLSRLLFWGKGSSLPAPKTSPAPPAHPESPLPHGAQHRRRGCPAGLQPGLTLRPLLHRPTARPRIPRGGAQNPTRSRCRILPVVLWWWRIPCRETRIRGRGCRTRRRSLSSLLGGLRTCQRCL